MTRRLIVNADDFGFSVGVTEGILRAHRAGILTSTTLMTTMPDRDRAIDLALATPTLGVGIHLCLTQGVPRTAAKGILTAEGMFVRSLPKLVLRLARKENLAAVEAEWEAQIAYAIERGLRPTHLDSHKHVHHLPALGRIAGKLAVRHGIGFVRCAREAQVAGVDGGGLGYRALAWQARRRAKEYARTGIRTSDWFFGLATTGRTDAGVWGKLLAACPEGTGEVMVHPGDPQDLTAEQTRLIAERKVELEALCDPAVKAAVEEGNIELTHYGRLAGCYNP